MSRGERPHTPAAAQRPPDSAADTRNPLVMRHPILLLLVGCLLTAPPARAQVVLDGSLGGTPGQAVGAGDGADYLITDDLGTLRGSNLFYSFRDFNVRTGELARFTGPDAVQNLIARVTGGRPSSIDGTIASAIPGSHLYFLNPAGLLFGANALLDVTGSFHASTATQLRFVDGSTFAARMNAPHLLSAASPAEFGFLDAQAPITVNGSNLFVVESTLELFGSDVHLTNYASVNAFNFVNSRAANVLISAIPGAGLDRRAHGRLTVHEGSAVDGDNVSLTGRNVDLNSATLTGALRTAITADDINVSNTYLFNPSGTLDLEASNGVVLSDASSVSALIFTIRSTDARLSGIEAMTGHLLIESDRILLDGATSVFSEDTLTEDRRASIT